eukprot:5495536-Karenia_brevis.AAC.1
MQPYISDVQEALRLLYDSARQDPDMNAIWRQIPFMDRFNIDAAQVAQLQGAAPEAAADTSTSGNADTAYGNYVRFLFQKNEAYRITNLGA